MAILETEDLGKLYRMGELKVHALSDVHFKVEKGEFVAIMGPSGSGKSTLLHLLGGLDGCSEGQISLNGKPISMLSDRQITLVRRRQVGIVFQFFNLIPTLNAAENVGLPLIIDGKPWREVEPRVMRLLQLVGLADRAHHRPNQLSGGQQQRVSIARALAASPALILADEPTGNLDSRASEEILTLLRRSCDDFEQTIVMVTHDAKAAAFADRVVFLSDGKLRRQVKVTGQRVEDIERIQAALMSLEDEEERE